MQHVLGLDHVIILVRDLDDAEARMARLGFRPTPRGYHSAHMGTANATVMLPNGTYFETLGVVQPTPKNADTRAMLTKREGPFGLALKTDDAHGAAAGFEAAGIADGAALDFIRPVELPGGNRDARFTIASTRSGVAPGVSLFVCQQHTPDIVWREDFLDQPNGATGLAEVIGVAADLAAIEQAYGVIFGDRVERGEDRVTIAAGDAVITFATPGAFAERFGSLGAAVSAPTPRLAGLGFQAPDLDRVKQLLQRNDVPCTEAASSVLIAPHEACGTLIVFS
jgi:catechol 2,3-dioxygenase-like lactoylglutathione lyase family enzyme